MVTLRDMIERDIEDYVKWFTIDTEWGNWDAPWEALEGSAEDFRNQWTHTFEIVKNYPTDKTKYRFEIEHNGTHIGWVSFYTSSDYFENPEKAPIIGIDIPDISHRKNGNGTKALQLFIDYLKNRNFTHIYTQTWSGNLPMIKVAEKLGFTEVMRKEKFRTVNGQKYDAITFKLNLQQ